MRQKEELLDFRDPAKVPSQWHFMGHVWVKNDGEIVIMRNGKVHRIGNIFKSDNIRENVMKAAVG